MYKKWLDFVAISMKQMAITEGKLAEKRLEWQKKKYPQFARAVEDYEKCSLDLLMSLNKNEDSEEKNKKYLAAKANLEQIDKKALKEKWELKDANNKAYEWVSYFLFATRDQEKALSLKVRPKKIKNKQRLENLNKESF